MKRFSKLIGFILVFIAVMAAFCSISFAATIGQPLTSPEDGWRRYDDNDSRISYTGTFSLETANSNYYNNTEHNIYNSGKIRFKFWGTKLRIIGYLNTTQEGATIKIDGVTYGNIRTHANSISTKILVFETSNLLYGIHTVEMTPITTGKFTLDAIDIDDTGYLIDINSPDFPIYLSATPGIAKIDLSWSAVEGATSYNIKRSTTSGGPYATITTTSAITYTDTNVENGITYYYVVSAIVSGTESPNSPEGHGIPIIPEEPPVVTGNSAILEITMVTGEIKEYDLTDTELQSFLTWYDGRSNGADKAYYIFTKKNNIKPFLSRKEYISYDKISSFEVNEYDE